MVVVLEQALIADDLARSMRLARRGLEVAIEDEHKEGAELALLDHLPY